MLCVSGVSGKSQAMVGRRLNYVGRVNCAARDLRFSDRYVNGSPLSPLVRTGMAFISSHDLCGLCESRIWLASYSKTREFVNNSTLGYSFLHSLFKHFTHSRNHHTRGERARGLAKFSLHIARLFPYRGQKRTMSVHTLLYIPSSLQNSSFSTLRCVAFL